MRALHLVFAASVAVVAMGITNCSQGDDDSSEPAHIAVAACDAAASALPQHRDGASCPTTRATGMYGATDSTDSGSTALGSCQSDADCTDGKNGRCGNEHQLGHVCTYDKCITDADCASGTVCNCDSVGGNACLPANCKTDADCGSGFTCAATYDTTCGSFDGIVGYYCHSAKDDCQSTCDCSDCSWGGAADKWICPANDPTCSG